MKYLLDTCVISELSKESPDEKVIAWISEIEEKELFISVITLGELHKGVERLPEGRKKTYLHNWINYDIKERFKNRIIDFDLQTATIWGKILARTERKGTTMPAIDSQIAATGLCYELTVVTRNIPDMKASGVALHNPWK